MSVEVLSLEELALLSSYLGEHDGHGIDLADRTMADLAIANAATYAARYEVPVGYVPSVRELTARRQRVHARVSDLQALRLLRKLNYNIWPSVATPLQAGLLLDAFVLMSERYADEATLELRRLARRRRVLGERALKPQSLIFLLRRFHDLTAQLTRVQPGTTFASTF